MLVPSTFTGWYRKMMMKAEIAREITRSRTQTPIPVPRRAGTIGRGSAAAIAQGVVASAALTGVGSEKVPDMRFYCIQNPSPQQRVAWSFIFSGTLMSSGALAPLGDGLQ